MANDKEQLNDIPQETQEAGSENTQAVEAPAPEVPEGTEA